MSSNHHQGIQSALAELPQELKPQAAPLVTEKAMELLPPPCRILICGAGRGGLSYVLHSAGYKVTSVDLHPEHFRARPLTCRHVDLVKPLPFAGNEFDCVLAVEVIEHLENPWLFFREAIRVARENGRFLFTSPNVQTLASRLAFLRCGLLHYFRESSFRGCYHVSPIFDWNVERMALTTSARVASIRYSRTSWPRRDDVPRRHSRSLRYINRVLPCGRLLGEVAVYDIVKAAGSSGQPGVPPGTHYA